MNPLYPEIHIPLSALGLLLHGVIDWDSPVGNQLRSVLWEKDETEAKKVMEAFVTVDLTYVRSIVALQRVLIPETQEMHQYLASMLHFHTGNKTMDV